MATLTLEQQQILAVWDLVKKRLSPAVLSNYQTNADNIHHYLSKNKLAWTVENVLSAVQTLHAADKLLWDVDPVAAPKKSLEEIDAEFRAKEIKRVQAEKAANAVPFTERVKQAEEARKLKELRDKAFEEARNEINKLILNWTVNGLPGRIDETKSLAGRAVLRGIKIVRAGEKTEDPTLTLAVIQRVYHLETADAIQKAIPRAIQELNNAGKTDKERQRAEEKRQGGGPLVPRYY
jgi:hypothetical protein